MDVANGLLTVKFVTNFKPTVFMEISLSFYLCSSVKTATYIFTFIHLYIHIYESNSYDVFILHRKRGRKEIDIFQRLLIVDLWQGEYSNPSTLD